MIIQDEESEVKDIEGLARMMAKSFNYISEKMATKDDIAAIRAEMATKDELNAGHASLAKQIHEVDSRLTNEIKDLRATLEQHLASTDRNYLAYNRKQDIIVKWIAQIAKETKVDIDLEEIERV